MKWTNKGHELDFIGNQFKNKKKVFIYSASEGAKQLYQNLAFLDCVAGFIDGSLEKQQNGFMGKTVYSISEINAMNKNEFIIVIAAVGIAGEKGIPRTLIFNGYKPCEDFFQSGIFMNTYLQIYAMYAHEKVVVFNYPQSVNEKCSLNCLYCNHSTPFLKDPINFPKEEFIADLDLFFKHVDYVLMASFLGGEIFVHPDVDEIMQYIVENYRNRMACMNIFTNGTIVPSDKMMELIEKYDVNIVFSDYREHAPQVSSNVEKFLNKMGDKVHVDYAEDWRDYAIGRAELGLKTEAEKMKHFDFCANTCRYMREGKLYFCTCDRLAQRAKMTEIDDSSYIDFTDMTKERRIEILEFEFGFNTRGYLLLCEKCYGYTPAKVIKAPMGLQYTGKDPLTLKKFSENDY